MKLLLDTHVLIWWLDGSRKLGERALSHLTATDAELSASAVSWWEIGIKSALGRMTFDWHTGREILASNRIKPLLVTFAHAEAAAGLPLHHGDPFDRMLVAQASHEGLRLLTRDKKLKVYGSSVLCV
ncbi:MAG TPA: type II toxin-antitoxin system VapC family toxin [Rhizomicrobium sp.]